MTKPRRDRLRPLTPLFDTEPRRGGIVIGNTPGSLPPRTVTITHLDTYNDPTYISNPFQVGLNGTTLWVDGVGRTLVGLDVSDPSNITFAGSTATLAAVQGMSSIVFSGSTAFVSLNNDLTFPQNMSIRSIDVSNPASPTPISSVELTGATSGSGATSLAFVGSTLVAVDPIQDRVYTLDVSNPAAMSVLGSVALTNGNSVVSVGGYAIVSSSSVSSMYTVDVSTPASPAIVDTLAIPHTANFGMRLLSGSLIAINQFSTDKVSIVDASDPLNLANRGFLQDAVNLDQPLYMSSKSDSDVLIMGVRDGSKLAPIDVSDPDAPALIDFMLSGQFTSNIAGSEWSGGHLYLCTDQGVKSYSVSVSP